MNYKLIWSDILDSIFKDKISILVQFKQFSHIEDYSSVNKKIKIFVSRKYLEDILMSKTNEIKTLFEKKTKKPIIDILINNKLIEQKFVQRLNPVIEETNLNSQDSKPISYSSIEKTFNDEVFIKENDLGSSIASKVQNLDFFNKKTNKTRTLIYYKKWECYKKQIIISLILIWTIIVPCVFLCLAINNKLNLSKINREVNDLISNNWKPVNFYSKAFVKNLNK